MHRNDRLKAQRSWRQKVRGGLNLKIFVGLKVLRSTWKQAAKRLDPKHRVQS